MPTYLRPDDKPVVQFDPLLELSPFTLFRRMKEGRAPALIDVRRAPRGRTFLGATPYPGERWEPDDTVDTLLFDQDGTEAEEIVRRLHAAGFERVRMLFGGLDLYEFSLDPQVVGEETFLIDLDA
jgi:hypothetical protein